MIVLVPLCLLVNLLYGWLLGQFFKVAVLLPAICLATPVILAASVSRGDAALQMALKVATSIWLMAIGYALGQLVLNLPCILRGLRNANI